MKRSLFTIGIVAILFFASPRTFASYGEDTFGFCLTKPIDIIDLCTICGGACIQRGAGASNGVSGSPRRSSLPSSSTKTIAGTRSGGGGGSNGLSSSRGRTIGGIGGGNSTFSGLSSFGGSNRGGDSGGSGIANSLRGNQGGSGNAGNNGMFSLLSRKTEGVSGGDTTSSRWYSSLQNNRGGFGGNSDSSAVGQNQGGAGNGNGAGRSIFGGDDAERGSGAGYASVTVLSALSDDKRPPVSNGVWSEESFPPSDRAYEPSQETPASVLFVQTGAAHDEWRMFLLPFRRIVQWVRD